MKKIIAIFVLFLFITACGSGSKSDVSKTDSTSVVVKDSVKADSVKVESSTTTTYTAK